MFELFLLHYTHGTAIAFRPGILETYNYTLRLKIIILVWIGQWRRNHSGYSGFDSTPQNIIFITHYKLFIAVSNLVVGAIPYAVTFPLKVKRSNLGSGVALLQGYNALCQISTDHHFKQRNARQSPGNDDEVLFSIWIEYYRMAGNEAKNIL